MRTIRDGDKPVTVRFNSIEQASQVLAKRFPASTPVRWDPIARRYEVGVSSKQKVLLIPLDSRNGT